MHFPHFTHNINTVLHISITVSFIKSATMGSAGNPVRLTRQNLMPGFLACPKLGAHQCFAVPVLWGQQLPPSHINHTKGQICFYMEQLLQIEPEGAQVVLRVEIQIEGKDTVCLESAFRPPICWDEDIWTLKFLPFGSANEIISRSNYSK